MNEKERNMSKTSLGPVSPSKHHSHIPVPSRTRTESGTGKKTVSPGKISPKDCVSRIARKTTSGPQKRMSATVSSQSRSSSPLRLNPKPNYKNLLNGRSRSTSNTSGKVKRTENNEQCVLPKISSRRKNSTESSLNYTKSYTTITLSSPRAEESDCLTDNSPAPESPDMSGGISPDRKDICESESVSKTSLHCDFVDGERLNYCDVVNPQIDLLDLRLKDSESELFSTVPGSSMSSARQTVSTESRSSPKFETLQTPQTTIRTLSGDELVLSSSMEFDDLDGDILPTENEETISQLLKQTEDQSFIKAFEGARAIEDEANEYDSEEATDADVSSKEKLEEDEEGKGRESENGICERAESRTDRINPEMELMTDMDYRQFVYHPTVLRRQMEEESQVDRRPRSKSIEDNNSFRLGDTDWEKSKRSSFKKNLSQTFVSDRDVNINPLRTWSEKMPPDEERQLMYSNLHFMQNSDYVLKEMKRERSKRERITGAVLRLTAKFIHLLAILNLWPGDNCQLLTSHSLSYGR